MCKCVYVRVRAFYIRLLSDRDDKVLWRAPHGNACWACAERMPPHVMLRHKAQELAWGLEMALHIAKIVMCKDAH